MFIDQATPVAQQGVNVVFIDADSFHNKLQSTKFTIHDYVQMVLQRKRHPSVSALTFGYFLQLNDFLQLNVLMQSNVVLDMSERAPTLTAAELNYVKDSVLMDLTQPSGTYLQAESQNTETKVSYDTLPLDGQTVVVVVQKGFANHLADSKDNFRGFVLACIRCMDSFNCDKTQLNQLYLSLQMTAAPFELLRISIQ